MKYKKWVRKKKVGDEWERVVEEEVKEKVGIE